MNEIWWLTILAANWTALTFSSLSLVEVLKWDGRCWLVSAYGDCLAGLERGDTWGLDVERNSPTLSIRSSVSMFIVRNVADDELLPVATNSNTWKTVSRRGGELGCGHLSSKVSAGIFMHHSPIHIVNDNSNRFIWSLQTMFKDRANKVFAKSCKPKWWNSNQCSSFPWQQTTG